MKRIVFLIVCLLLTVPAYGAMYGTPDIEREITFMPGQFVAKDSTDCEIDASSGIAIDIENNASVLIWANGETTPVQVTFSIPPSYASGGAFRAFCDSNATTTPTKVDFDVYVNVSGSPWDGAATDQTPVALTKLAGTPELVSLAVATDFASLAVGDIITVNVWRDNAADGTDNLELYYLKFFYQATQ